MGWKSIVILADLKNTPLLQSCHMALLEERKAVVWDLIWEVRCLNHFWDSSHYPDFRCCRICNYFVHKREAKESNIMLEWLRNVSLACVASVSARVSRESWDEAKKKRNDGQWPAKTSVSPRSSSLGTFRADEGLRLSETSSATKSEEKRMFSQVRRAIIFAQ